MRLKRRKNSTKIAHLAHFGSYNGQKSSNWFTNFRKSNVIALHLLIKSQSIALFYGQEITSSATA